MFSSGSETESVRAMLDASWKDSVLGSYKVRQCSVKSQLMQKSELMGHHVFSSGLKKTLHQGLLYP